MRCTSPRTVGYQHDGRSLEWSQKRFNKELATFQLPCGKCIECRLEYARDAATRCMHESQMHPENSFVTLTYSDENLRDNRLDYSDFQGFMKRLRTQRWRDWLAHLGKSEDWYHVLPKSQKKIHSEALAIPFFATGEYGDKSKRMHWHAILFNYSPQDLKKHYVTDLGHQVFKSEELNNIWQHGNTEVGSVTAQSANYVARYSAKKLCHGDDQSHVFQPIHKRSTRHAIGKKWLETYYPDILKGFVTIDGARTAVPRYYWKWLEKHRPAEFRTYVATVRSEASKVAGEKAESLRQKTDEINRNRIDSGRWDFQISRDKVREEISKSKLKHLNSHLKET